MGNKLLALPELNERSRQFGRFDDFLVGPVKKQVAYTLANGAANADLAAAIIGGFSAPVILTEAYITPDGSATGVDGSNTSEWTLTDGTNTLATKTFDGTTTFPADNTRTSLGTIANGYLPAGGRLELTVTNGTTADLPAVRLEVEYYECENYFPGWELFPINDGAAVLTDAAGGVITLASGATDNNETYLGSIAEFFKIAAGKPIVVQSRVKFTEAATNDANVIFGLMNAVGANALVDDGAGPKANYSGACFFKVDGSTTWSVENSDSTTQKTTNLDGTQSLAGAVQDAVTAGGGVWEELTIELLPTGAGTMDVNFYRNGVQVARHIGQSYANATEMQVVLGIKAGGGNSETLYVDYAAPYQLR